MQSKTTTKIIIDKLKLDVLFRLNVSNEIIVKRIKGEHIETDDPVVNDLLDSFIDTKTFSNWGGNHNPTGKNQYTNKIGQSGQLDHHLDHQVDRSRLGQDADKDIDNNTRNNTSNLSTTRTKENQIANQNEKPHVHNALEIFGNSFRATDAVVDIFDRPDGTTKHGIRIKNPRLMAFVRQRFDQTTLNKVSDWAISHNQRGRTYNASALLKLLCKFQSNIEPSINYNSVQAQYLSFEYTAVGGTK